jgi:hypothetical protein
MGNPVMTAIMMVLRLGIGLILFRLALKGKSNLHWLAACFYLNFLVLLLPGPRLMLASQAVVIIIQICLAMFTHATFYQNRRSPIGWVIAGILLGGSASLYLWVRHPEVGGLRMMFLIGAANWFWHAWVAWQAWRKLRGDQAIEDWIKARYAMVVAYALLMSALFTFPLFATGQATRVFYGWAWPLTITVSVVLQYLAWGMPSALRRFLNRNYKAPAAFGDMANMTEEELLRAMEPQQPR